MRRWLRESGRTAPATFPWRAALALAVVACSGVDASSGRSGSAAGSPEEIVEIVPEAAGLLEPAALGPTRMRRQTRAEIRASLRDIFGVDPGALSDLLPEDVTRPETINPFDNDAELQDVSTDLVVRYGGFAAQYAAVVAKAPSRLHATAGCTPAGSSDSSCFEAIVRNIGRLAFRRRLAPPEVERFGEFLRFAEEDGDFSSAVDALVQALVQHPEFVYRVEIGAPTATPGVYALDGNAIATRLAFLFWGRGPDAALLDAAEAGKLASPGGRREQAERLLADPRAKEQWRRFHAQWLGYANVPLPAELELDMKAESAALVDRVVFDEGRSWLDLFRADETFVSPDLARHYGLEEPSASSWVPYDPSRGGGVLSHGAFLLQGSKFGDTSPTLRGYRLLKRILCKDLGAIPPGIDTDNPPMSASPTACKPARYSMRSSSSCASCHGPTDGIGFGLERFGPSGALRTSEPGLPNCNVDGKGDFYGKPFTGPRELGAILAEAPELAQCADKQLLRFAVGRPDASEDAATLRALDAQLAKKPSLTSLLRALAETPAITFRVERSSP